MSILLWVGLYFLVGWPVTVWVVKFDKKISDDPDVELWPLAYPFVHLLWPFVAIVAGFMAFRGRIVPGLSNLLRIVYGGR